MKVIKILTISIILFTFGCSSPKPFEIKDVCTQPIGTEVVTQGYVSLPKTIETIQLSKGGRITAVGYQLFVMTKADATGDAVKATFWTTTKAEPNKVKAFSYGYTWSDLLVYTNDGKEVSAGKVIKVTGETVADEKTGCVVAVTKIENP